MRRSSFVWSLLLLVVASPAWAGDWAYWRGPEHDGISRETGLIDDWSLEDGTNVLWDSPIGGRAAPIILGGKVYLNSRTNHDVADPDEKIHAREQVVCWDLESGEVEWRDEFNVFQTDIPAPRVGWASMCGDTETGNVYVHSVGGIFRCYSGDGKKLWDYSLFEEYGKISGYGGRTQSPIIDEDRVIVSYLVANWGDTKGPAPKHTYYAFDKNDGRLLWVSAPGGSPKDTNYSTPIIRVIDGVRMLIGGNSDGGLYAINARTGEPIWGFRMSRRGLNASAVVDGNLVYISHGEDNIDNVAFGRVQCIDATGRGDITDTHGKWRVDGIKAGYASLLVKDGILFVVTDTGNMIAFDAKDGTRLWEHDLGTVGKGSPVWADGKIYIFEVNGNVHILKASREKCETLSRVQIGSADGQGMDEIYSSPAIADGKIVIVTRDRTICLGVKDKKPSSNPIPPLADEGPAGDEVALVQLVPYEVRLNAGESSEFELRAFDKQGRFIKTHQPMLEVEDGLADVTADGATITAGDATKDQAGTVVAKYGDLVAKARVRVFPPLPWSWDFTGYKGKRVPPTWIRAFIKLQPAEIDGESTLRNAGGKGRPSHWVWIGTPDMKDYTVQTDFLMIEKRRRLSSVGVTVNRYNLIVKANTGKLSIQSWQPHLRMAKEMKFRSNPDVWYRMKLRVDVKDDGAHIRGKVWERDKPEPEEWTIETVDPHANENGAPGLYMYALAEAYYDNVKVTANE